MITSKLREWYSALQEGFFCKREYQTIGILRNELDSQEAIINSLEDENKALNNENAILGLELDSLKELVVPEDPDAVLKEYWEHRREKTNSFRYTARAAQYGGPRILIDPRVFFTPLDNAVPTVSGDSYDDKAFAALRHVIRSVRYQTDRSLYDAVEHWPFAYETVSLRAGDCDGGAILLANILLKSGVPYWRVRLNAGDVKGGGHAWVTYLRESDNQWVILDWCFVDNKRTLVSTPKGKRRFSQLKVGDEVISFNEKTKKIETSKIVKVGSRDVSNTLRIKYLNAGGKEEYVECTEEHPFFVGGKWVKAGNLSVGDEVYGVQPRALYAIAGNHKKTKEWSMKVADKNRELGVYDALSKRQTENNVAKRPEARKKLRENTSMERPEVVEKAFAKRLANGYKSGHELGFIDKIEELNLPVRFVGDGSFWVKGKNPDFKVEGEKKVIEVTQYNYLGRDEKWAAERAKHFEDNGFKCLILFYDRRGNLLFTSDDDIVRFVMNGFKIVDIQKLSGKKKVWNIHCEGNNNYFVNGMLVHNCYWPDKSLGGLLWRDAEDYFRIWFSLNQFDIYAADMLDRDSDLFNRRID
jgi:hypothetical protein